MTNPYLTLYTAAAQHPLQPAWADFYRAAHWQAAWWASMSGRTVGVVADLIAALSPMKSWPENLRLTEACLTAAADTYSSAYEAKDFEPVGLMLSRRKAAARALNGLGVSGPKVECFAQNIRGNLSVVTIDRHMAEAASENPNRLNVTTLRRLQGMVEDVSRTVREYPATVQAVIWGYVRYKKGYKTV